MATADGDVGRFFFEKMRPATEPGVTRRIERHRGDNTYSQPQFDVSFDDICIKSRHGDINGQSSILIFRIRTLENQTLS